MTAERERELLLNDIYAKCLAYHWTIDCAAAVVEATLTRVEYCQINVWIAEHNLLNAIDAEKDAAEIARGI